MIDPQALGLETYNQIGENEIRVKCPYHDDKTPSAEFNYKRGVFYCFGCGTSKKADQIAKDLGGEIVEVFSLGSKLHSLKFAENITWRTRLAFAPLAYDNIYLTSREVTNDDVTRYDIRDFGEGEGIGFPMHDADSNPMGFQMRYYTREPKYKFFGDRPSAYPLNFIRHMPDPFTMTYLVEGVFGVLRGRKYGKRVFATLGSAAIALSLRHFPDTSSLIGYFDPDFAGTLAMLKLTSIGIRCVVSSVAPDDANKDMWDNLQTTTDMSHFYNQALYQGANRKQLDRMIIKFRRTHA